MEHTHLGNPFRVSDHYAQGEAAAAYLSYLRQQVRAGGPERQQILALAQRLAVGENLVICCFCTPRPGQDTHITLAMTGYARQLGWTG